MAKVFVGHDWAEAHHDVHVEDEACQQLAAMRLPEGIEGVRRFHGLIGAHVEEPAGVTIATETDRGLFVGSLVAAGYRVLAVNPMSTSRYRERYSSLGAKSDPGDAKVLAELARLAGHDHRSVAAGQRSHGCGQGARMGASLDDLEPATSNQSAPLDAA